MDPAGAPRLETLDVVGLVIRAQKGDAIAREEILESYRDFAAAIASRKAGRPLDPRNDDELSVSLLALNEALFDRRGFPFILALGVRAVK